MTLVLGTLVVALVLLMVLAMALAEWADKDPGDLLSALFRRRQPEAVSPKAVSAAPTAVKTAAPGSTAKSGRAAGSRKTAAKSSTTTSSRGKRKRK